MAAGHRGLGLAHSVQFPSMSSSAAEPTAVELAAVDRAVHGVETHRGELASSTARLGHGLDLDRDHAVEGPTPLDVTDDVQRRLALGALVMAPVENAPMILEWAGIKVARTANGAATPAAGVAS